MGEEEKDKHLPLRKRWETEKDDQIKVIKKADLPPELREPKEEE